MHHLVQSAMKKGFCVSKVLCIHINSIDTLLTINKNTGNGAAKIHLDRLYICNQSDLAICNHVRNMCVHILERPQLKKRKL